MNGGTDDSEALRVLETGIRERPSTAVVGNLHLRGFCIGYAITGGGAQGPKGALRARCKRERPRLDSSPLPCLSQQAS